MNHCFIYVSSLLSRCCHSLATSSPYSCYYPILSFSNVSITKHYQHIMSLILENEDESQSILEGNFDFILDEIIVNNNIHHQCHLCPQTFLTKTEFKTHLKHHGQQERFVCSHCHHSYLTSTKLWSHMSRSHFKATKGFFCSLCDNKAFKHAFNYHLHMLIHLGEQPEKCRFCSKAFRTKPSLRKHELIHTGLFYFFRLKKAQKKRNILCLFYFNRPAFLVLLSKGVGEPQNRTSNVPQKVKETHPYLVFAPRGGG